MKIIDLIKICPFEQVAGKLTLHYNLTNIDEFRKLYSRLEKMKINGEFDFYIYISAFKASDTDDVYVTDFDENDTTLYYDVSGYYGKSDSTIYSIASFSFSDFISFQIDGDTLSKYSYDTILAHCLYEITYYGFDDTDR
ncbi:MAG: hypothetical protein K2K57_09665 [Oscillospiraceae bacterium]|nr:hypothetical protein [Oscillospiraceae bacterium]